MVLDGVALLMVGAVAWSSCYSGDGDAQQQQQQLELEQQQVAAAEESVASASSRAGEGRETLKGGVP